MPPGLESDRHLYHGCGPASLAVERMAALPHKFLQRLKLMPYGNIVSPQILSLGLSFNARSAILREDQTIDAMVSGVRLHSQAPLTPLLISAQKPAQQSTSKDGYSTLVNDSD
jgi:hypothetical protein